jgi:hypothetical protein
MSLKGAAMPYRGPRLGVGASSGFLRRAAGITLLGSLAWSAAACDDAERDASGAIVERGEVGWAELRVGDCFQDWENALSGDVAEITEVSAIPCSQPHDNEVYHLFELSAGGDFPGDESIERLAIDGCFQPFEAFVGRDYASSRLDYGWVVPTSASWSQDDREIVCFLFDLEYRDLTGSMRGSRE